MMKRVRKALTAGFWGGVSAVGAFVNPATGDVTNVRWDNGGTVLGAVCFLVAAVMLIPEARSVSNTAGPGQRTSGSGNGIAVSGRPKRGRNGDGT